MTLYELGVIGAGNYASSMLLPHLQTNDKVVMSTVATSRPCPARMHERKFAFARRLPTINKSLPTPQSTLC